MFAEIIFKARFMRKSFPIVKRVYLWHVNSSAVSVFAKGKACIRLISAVFALIKFRYYAVPVYSVLKGVERMLEG